MSTDTQTLTADSINPAAGEHAKHDGMADADEQTDADWASECDAAIEVMAALRIPFQASDLVEAGLVGEPEKHQQWGPRFGYAARRGVIREHSSDKSNRKNSHRSRLVTWIGV